MSSQAPSRRGAKRRKKLTGKDPVDTPMPDAEQTQGEGLQKKAPFTFLSVKSQLQSTPMEGIESTAAGEDSRQKSKLTIGAAEAPNLELSRGGEDEAAVIKPSETSPATEDTSVRDAELSLSAGDEAYLQTILNGGVTLRGKAGVGNIFRLLQCTNIRSYLRNKQNKSILAELKKKLMDALGIELFWKFYWLKPAIDTVLAKLTGNSRVSKALQSIDASGYVHKIRFACEALTGCGLHQGDLDSALAEASLNAHAMIAAAKAEKAKARKDRARRAQAAEHRQRSLTQQQEELARTQKKGMTENSSKGMEVAKGLDAIASFKDALPTVQPANSLDDIHKDRNVSGNTNTKMTLSMRPASKHQKKKSTK